MIRIILEKAGIGMDAKVLATYRPALTGLKRNCGPCSEILLATTVDLYARYLDDRRLNADVVVELEGEWGRHDTGDAIRIFSMYAAATDRKVTVKYRIVKDTYAKIMQGSRILHYDFRPALKKPKKKNAA